jgi:hypothetical protein
MTVHTSAAEVEAATESKPRACWSIKEVHHNEVEAPAGLEPATAGLGIRSSVVIRGSSPFGKVQQPDHSPSEVRNFH